VSESSKIPSGSVVALSAAAFCSGISLRVTDAMLPKLAAEFSVSLGQAALVITVFAVAYGLAQLFFGPLGDRFGKYRVIGWGCVASAITNIFCALSPDLSSLMINRALAGAAAASVIPLAMAWIGDVIEYEHRQPVLARFLIGQIVGISGGVLLGGYAADYASWRMPFYVIAVAFSLIAVLIIRVNRSLPGRARQTKPGQSSVISHMLHEFSHVLMLPWARVVVVTVFVEGAMIYGSFAFLVAHLHRVHGISLSMAGQVVMLFGAGGLTFALSAHKLLPKLGEVGLCRVGGVLVSIAFAVMALAPHWAWAAPAVTLAGLGFYMLHNTLQINATQMAPERRGAAVAAFASLFFLGQSLGVALAGGLIRWIDTTGVLLLGAVGVLLVSSAFAAAARRRRAVSGP
jgi:predicted MFS family arabinose efflux permease